MVSVTVMYSDKKMLTVILIKFFLTIWYISKSSASNDFDLSIIHLNDFHARFEETSPSSDACKDSNCVGGFSRIYTTINKLIKENPNPIVLNAGDNFQGTLWYNVYKWNVTQYFLNLLPFDAYTLGNHEFDDGIEGVVPFIKALHAPVVVANVDDKDEPNFQKLYTKSVVVERNGKKIGIIGVTTTSTHHLSRPGKLKFLDEVTSVNNEAEKLTSETQIDTIIVLSHCGYEVDKQIAKNAASKIGLIVGGHSHTFLYTGNKLPGPDIPQGDYPTVINHEDGRRILIVQASALSKYIGNITVKYNNDGDVISWRGAPVYLNNEILKDENINKKLKPWEDGLNKQNTEVLGSTRVLLDNKKCRYSECNIGNFITDGMVFSQLNTADDEDNSHESHSWTYASIAIINSSGIKSSIIKGNITFNDLTLALPFRNTIDTGEIKGKFLKEALEHAGGSDNIYKLQNMNLLQVSGLRIVYNISQPFGSKVQSVKVLCRKCSVPSYEELNLEESYRIVTNAFLNRGGEGHGVLRDHVFNKKVGRMDIDVLAEYITKNSPIVQRLEDRIIVLH